MCEAVLEGVGYRGEGRVAGAMERAVGAVETKGEGCSGVRIGMC